jgi:hypothetical protein
MRARREDWSVVAGVLTGIALVVAMPLAAADPAPKSRPEAQAQHGHSVQSHTQGHSEGRWNSANAHQGTEPAPHGDAAHHDAAAHAAGPEIGFRGCAYFENADFAGRRGELREGASAEWVGRAWNDRISSVACHSGCRLIGYVDINYGGQRRNFSGAVAELGADWNDRISAMRAVCGATDAAHH